MVEIHMKNSDIYEMDSDNTVMETSDNERYMYCYTLVDPTKDQPRLLKYVIPTENIEIIINTKEV